MAGPWSVEPGMRHIKFHGTGIAHEAIHIVVSRGGTKVARTSAKLNANGQRTYVFFLPAGTYDVSITAPSLPVAASNHPALQVQQGTPPPSFAVLSSGAPKAPPDVQAGTGTLTVSGTGDPNEPVLVFPGQKVG